MSKVFTLKSAISAQIWNAPCLDLYYMEKAKLLVVGVLIFLNSVQSFAAEADFSEMVMMQSYLNEVLYPDQGANLYQSSMTVNDVEISNNCTSFVTLSSTLGPNGEYIMDQLATGQFDEMMTSRSLQSFCPRYAQMSVRQKSIIWVLILTTMAHFESSCDPSQTARGPNGTARGLFQLHQGHEAYYDGSENTCVTNASYDSTKSIRCTMGMINNQLKESNTLFYSRSYWDVLRPDGLIYKGKHKYEWIRDGIKNSAACRLNNT